MKNIKLTIEYDGTNYSGWQRQANGTTIQEIIEDTLKKITGEDIRIFGSGRTDAGVHAIAQVANFKTGSRMSPFQLMRALNTSLPRDISIIGSEDADEKFHAQYSAKEKTYLYRILNRQSRSPLERYLSWFVMNDLDMEKMTEAVRMLKGEHDFRAFAHADRSVKTTVRTVRKVSLKRKGDIIELEITAGGFLKRMVRLIAGTLVQVGRDRLSVEQFAQLLSDGKKENRVLAAPPQGLFLKKVKY